MVARRRAKATGRPVRSPLEGAGAVGAAPILRQSGDSPCRSSSAPFRRTYRPSLPGHSAPFSNSLGRGEVSLTGLCDLYHLQGPIPLEGRAFALTRTDELSVAGPVELQGDAPAEHARWLCYSATVSNLQKRSRDASRARADGWLVHRRKRPRSTLRAAIRTGPPRSRTDIDARRFRALQSHRQNSSN